MLDVALLVSIVVLSILWFWPEEKPDDTYHNPDHWGDQ